MIPHLHKYKFDAEVSWGHKHTITGYCEGMLGINILHFHFFCGVCSYNGHTHYYSGMTGLPIRTEYGHIHKIEGILEMNNMHEHGFCSYTYEDVAYTPRRLVIGYGQ